MNADVQNTNRKAELLANTVEGMYQRTPTSAAPGGQLTIGVPGGVPNNSFSGTDFLSPAIEITPSPTPVIVADDTSLTNLMLTPITL